MKTYTLMVADDEPLPRQVFCALIERNFDNIKIVGQAENGHQAVEVALEKKPDIIVLDVKMPGCSGLEAATQILAVQPRAQILILTAYDSFQFLQQAFDMGVKGYLLKPVKLEQLQEQLQRIFDDMSSQQDQLTADSRSANMVRTAADIVEEQLVGAFLNGVNIPEFSKKWEMLNQFPIEGGMFICFILQQDPGQHFPGGEIMKSVRSIIAGLFHCEAASMVGNYLGHLLPVFFSVSSQSEAAPAQKEALYLTRRALEKCSLVWKYCSAAVGSVYFDTALFSRSFRESTAALSDPVPGSVQLCKPSVCQPLRYPYEMEDRLLEEIVVGNAEEIAKILDEILHVLLTSGAFFQEIRQAVVELFVMVKRTITDLGMDFDQLKAETIPNSQNLLTMEQLCIYIRQVRELLLNAVKMRQGNQNIALIHKIKRYLNTHDPAQLSLDSLAEELKLSPQYVSRVFKDAFGKNFKDYLTDCRIDAAKKLLRSGKRSISDIAMEVGYKDPNYFCRIFKKVTGTSPKEFRKLS